MKKITFKGKTDNIKEQGFNTIIITDCSKDEASIYFGDGRGKGFSEVIEIGRPYPIYEYPLIYLNSGIDECTITYKFTNL